MRTRGIRASLARNWVVFVVVAPLAVVYLLASRGMDARSAIMPQLTSAAILALVVVIVVRDWRNLDLDSHRKGPESWAGRLRSFSLKWYKAIGSIILMGLLIPASEWLGFYPAGAVFLFASFTLLQIPGWIRRAVLSLVTMVAAYGLFERVLEVPLP